MKKDKNKGKEKKYNPPEIKVCEVKKLLEGWDNRLFGKVAVVGCCCIPTA